MKYIHVRSTISNKQVVREGKMKHPVPFTKFNAVSVGFEVVPDSSGHAQIYGHIACCKRNDQFCRRRARDIIAGRCRKHGPKLLAVIGPQENAINTLIKMFHPDVGTTIQDMMHKD